MDKNKQVEMATEMIDQIAKEIIELFARIEAKRKIIAVLQNHYMPEQAAEQAAMGPPEFEKEPLVGDEVTEELFRVTSGRYYISAKEAAKISTMSRKQIEAAMQEGHQYFESRTNTKTGEIEIRKKVRALPLLLSLIRVYMSTHKTANTLDILNAVARNKILPGCYKLRRFETPVRTTLRRIADGTIKPLPGIKAVWDKKTRMVALFKED